MPDHLPRYLAAERIRPEDPDEAAWVARVIFSRYWDKLEQYTANVLSDQPGWHDDVMMDAMLRVFERRAKLLEHPSPVKWVFRVISFVAMERRKKENRNLRIVYDADGATPTLYSDVQSDDKMRSEEVMQVIRQVMDTWMPHEREVFERSYFSGQDRHRIAREMGLASQTVSNLLSLARRKIWHKLEDLDQEI